MAQQERLKLGVPPIPREYGGSRHSEGSRLSEPIHRLLQRGCGLRYTIVPGELSTRVRGVLLDVNLMRGQDIARFVATGDLDAGIVGLDKVENLSDELRGHIKIVYPLQNIGECAFTLGIPEGLGYSHQSTIEDVAGLRVATALPLLAQRIFDERGVSVQLISMEGHVEVAPRLGVADAIVDITESGDTMRNNGLIPAEYLMRFVAVFISNDYPLGRGRERVLGNLQSRIERALQNPYAWMSSGGRETQNLLGIFNVLGISDIIDRLYRRRTPAIATS